MNSGWKRCSAEKKDERSEEGKVHFNLYIFRSTFDIYLRVNWIHLNQVQIRSISSL